MYYTIMKRVVNFTMTNMYTIIINDPENITIEDKNINRSIE